jgi:hypothetical protein
LPFRGTAFLTQNTNPTQVDEFLATKPELASKIDEEIKNHNYT